MINRMYIVEGAIEENFVEQLRENNIIVPGRVRVWNLMQKKLNHSNPILTKRVDEIFAIIDTDCVESSNLATFNLNIKELKSIGKVFVLVQNENFEDELCRILNANTIQQLCDYFNVKNRTRKGLKTFLSKGVNYKDRVTKDNIWEYGKNHSSFIGYDDNLRIQFITGQNLCSHQ